MDADGYPEDNELEKIKNWNFVDGYLQLMEYIKSLWHWDDYYIRLKPEPGLYQFELHTGGWSGNESLIGAMMNNQIFWMMCWIESRRGGHYKFEIKE